LATRTGPRWAKDENIMTTRLRDVIDIPERVGSDNYVSEKNVIWPVFPSCQPTNPAQRQPTKGAV